MLAGDFSGNRILKGAELVRQGFAPVAYVSGPFVIFGRNEAELAIEFAVRKGYPASYFQPLFHKADSTREEAAFLWGELQKKEVRRLLVVTSDFHTRRAGRVFRSVCGEGSIRVIAAPTENLDIGDWWQFRPSRKIIFMEWTKTIADWLGI